MKTLILSLISALLLTSCQVKQGAGSSGLISGHLPVTNAFTLSAPGAASYPSGTVLDFTLTHPFDVTVTGAPRLVLTIGAATVYANYVSGSGTKNLLFSYTVAPGDNDSDGIAVSPALDLNGGTVVFNATVNASTTINLPSTAGVLIDTTVPAISGAAKPPVSHYYTGLPMIFTVTYNEKVIVTGTPSINMTFDECTVAGAQIKNANYIAGSGTTTLTFSYTVENTCNETTNIPVTTSVQLNGGTIKDLAGNTAPVDFSAYVSTPIPNTTLVRGRYPMITSITAPADGTYVAGQNLDFLVNFDRVVTVSNGTSYLPMTLGALGKQVQYLSGTGTNQLTYRYIVVGGDVDSDGVTISPDIAAENTICSGTFCLVNGETDNVATVSSGVIVNAPVPSIVQIKVPNPLPPSGYYKLGDQVQVVVQFSENVTVTGGIPSLTSVVGVANKSLTYLSGSGTTNLIFVYTVQSDDLDTDGVMFTSPLVLNAATIQNAQGTNANLAFTYALNSSFRYDGVAPTVTGTSVTGTNHPNYRYNDFINVDVTFSETVNITGTPTIALTVGAAARTASYSSSISGTVKRFRYQVQATDHSSQVDTTLAVGTTLSGGTIRDVALNDISDRTMPATNTTGIKVDGAVPTVSSITPPANATYKQGQAFSFTVNFSEPVTVTGIPTWTMTFTSGGPGSASYSSGSGTSALVFNYTVDSNDLDANGISLASAFTFTGAAIADSSVGNNMANSFAAVLPNTASINVDGVAPTISTISGPAAATYDTGTNLDFTVTYSETVNITGFPQLTLDIGGTTKYATYLSGSGTTQAVYRYTVEANLDDKNGVQATAHILNAGTIADVAGNNANLTMATQTFGTVIVDSRGPIISSITPPANGAKVTGNTLSFTVNFDENVTVNTGGGTPYLALNIGGSIINATYASGSGTSALVFTTPAMTVSEFDADGIAYSGSSLTANGGTLRDALAHDATLTFTAGSLAGIKVIYSEVISWVEINTEAGANGAILASLTDRSPGGNSASANSGSVTKISTDASMGSQASANFDGASSLIYPSMSMRTIAIAFKAGGVPASDTLISGITLTNSTDLAFSALASYSIDGAAFTGGGLSCTNCYNSGTTKVIMLDFTLAAQTVAAVLGSGFFGHIAEVWVLNGAQGLTNAQKLKIATYLSSKY